jgi:MSHA biogenesis protein MshP
MKIQHGFTLVSAIFILLVFGLLGGYMLRTSAIQLDTTNYALQGARAYLVAKAGADWAIANIVNYGGTCTQVNAQTAMNFTGINGFTVGLSCTSQTYSEGAVSGTIYTITALSQYDSYSAGDYTARQVTVTVLH